VCSIFNDREAGWRYFPPKKNLKRIKDFIRERHKESSSEAFSRPISWLEFVSQGQLPKLVKLEDLPTFFNSIPLPSAGHHRHTNKIPINDSILVPPSLSERHPQ
jgi:hypothetical protein